MTKNAVPLTRDTLLAALTTLAQQLQLDRAFHGHHIVLTVHGGCVMVLHPALRGSRRSTQDVDFVARSFAVEWAAKGIHDAPLRLKRCIDKTAKIHGLGPDWMNADPDHALPMRTDAYGRQYCGVGHHWNAPDMLETMTVFSAPGLQLVAVPWFWAIALKIIRYQKHDPQDVAAILRMAMRRCPDRQWTPEWLEAMIVRTCSPMMQNYLPSFMDACRKRMADALYRARLPQIYYDG